MMKKNFFPFLVILFMHSIHAQQSSMLRINVNGLSVAYQKAGTGPALVLLHGFTQDSRVWKKQIDGLSKNFIVIAWDAPGAGLSDDPPGSYTMSDWADCLDAFLDSLHIRQAHILGISWGGVLAQEFYLRHPQKVSGLILADTNPGWSALSDSVAQDRLKACIQDTLLPVNDFVEKYLPGMFSNLVNQETKETLRKVMSDTHRRGFQLMATAIAKADMRRLYSSVKVPVLLVWGEKDNRAPVNIAHEMNNSIPNSKLVIIPGTGHVSNMEQPEWFNAVVKEFCLVPEKKK